MVTRNTVGFNRDPGRLPSGYEGTNIPDDFYIPSSNLRDIDQALFNLFDKEIGFQVTQNSQIQKVPVIYAGSERWSFNKLNKPLRDRDGTLIIPLISIRRTDIDQKEEQYFGRSLGVSTGDLVIKRRLSAKDPSYQALINKNNLKNQNNVAHSSHFIDAGPPGSGALPGKIASRRENIFGSGINSRAGELLAPQLGNNIFEVITMPFPNFVVLTYQIVFWTQYISQMNTLLEKLMNSYTSQGNNFQITSDKGYWYVAYVQDIFKSEENFDDYTEKERIIKYSVEIKVPGYLIAPEGSGDQSPFRKYLSAPQISFELLESQEVNVPDLPVSGDLNKFVLSDVVELDKTGNPVVKSNNQKTRLARNIVRDPFSGKESIHYVTIIDRDSRTGETVADSRLVYKYEDIGP